MASAICTVLGACSRRDSTATPNRAFGEDVAFLQQHTSIVLLGNRPDGARVAVAPGYQGRVMTSTTGGADGPSFGWIGRAAIASGQRQPHINVFGGEDRFWVGPEGGQFALYFRHGDPFDLDHWQVPEAIDWGAWPVATLSKTTVQFKKQMTVVNYANSRLDIDVERTVRLLPDEEVATALGTTIGRSVRGVAFESSNTVTNAGSAPWQPQSGLVSVWILGMFNPSAQTTIAIPFAIGADATLGPVVNDKYFGKVPSDRLVIGNGIIFFKGDGEYRSKIGLSPSRARSVAGSYDSAGRVLTLVQYSRPSGADAYVNSMWEIQNEPYHGDVINSYNDGPPAPGKPPLGPFYELETSSPALSLAPGARHTHVQRTFHLTGPEDELDRIARATLKVGVGELKSAFSDRR
jgi:hypothetical protein